MSALLLEKILFCLNTPRKMQSLPKKNAKISHHLFQDSGTEEGSAPPRVDTSARNGPPRSLTNISQPPRDTGEKVSLFFTLKK